MLRDEQFYRVLYGDTDVDMNTLVAVTDIDIEAGKPLEGFDDLTEDVMGEAKMSTGDGKLTLTLGNKSKKCDSAVVWIGRDDAVREKLIEYEGKRKCVIFVDTRTGFLQKANSQMINVNSDGTGGTYHKVNLVGTCDGMPSEVYQTKTLTV